MAGEVVTEDSSLLAIGMMGLRKLLEARRWHSTARAGVGGKGLVVIIFTMTDKVRVPAKGPDV